MANVDEPILLKRECKLFEELLQLVIDITENKEIDLGKDKYTEDLYLWFVTCREARLSSVLGDGDRIRQNKHVNDILILKLRECLLLHKWQDAVKVLEDISKSPLYRSHYVLLKVGLELIYRLKCGSQTFDNLAEFVRKETLRGTEEILIDLFNFKLITRLPEGINQLNRGSVVLDAISELVNEKVQNRGVFAAKTKVKPRNLKPIEETAEMMYNYYYSGLVAYVKWNVIRFKMEASEASDDEDESKLHNAAEKAIHHFSECEKYEGVWDIIVAKHIEILEHHAIFDKNSELLITAEQVLKDYEESYPTNPNAMKLLYKFYKRNSNSFDISLATKILVKISEKMPSDILVLELVSSDLEEVGFSRLELLFNLLDFHVWKNAAELWNALAKYLVEGLSDKDTKSEVMKTLKSCWEFRSEWWPEYHFQEWTGFASIDLDLSKASVAVVLLGKKSRFYKKVVKASRKQTVISEGFEILNRAILLEVSL